MRISLWPSLSQRTTCTRDILLIPRLLVHQWLLPFWSFYIHTIRVYLAVCSFLTKYWFITWCTSICLASGVWTAIPAKGPVRSSRCPNRQWGFGGLQLHHLCLRTNRNWKNVHHGRFREENQGKLLSRMTLYKGFWSTWYSKWKCWSFLGRIINVHSVLYNLPIFQSYVNYMLWNIPEPALCRDQMWIPGSGSRFFLLITASMLLNFRMENCLLTLEWSPEQFNKFLTPLRLRMPSIVLKSPT